MPNKNPPLYVGQRVAFQRTHHGQCIGTVVKESIYPWAPGANDVTIFHDETGDLVRLPTCAGLFHRIPGLAAELELAAAHEAYRKHLSQYPVWAARFAAGHDVAF